MKKYPLIRFSRQVLFTFTDLLGRQYFNFRSKPIASNYIFQHTRLPLIYTIFISPHYELSLSDENTQMLTETNGCFPFPFHHYAPTLNSSFFFLSIALPYGRSTTTMSYYSIHRGNSRPIPRLQCPGSGGNYLFFYAPADLVLLGPSLMGMLQMAHRSRNSLAASNIQVREENDAEQHSLYAEVRLCNGPQLYIASTNTA